jgi:hypothetical protein
MVGSEGGGRRHDVFEIENKKFDPRNRDRQRLTNITVEGTFLALEKLRYFTPFDRISSVSNIRLHIEDK